MAARVIRKYGNRRLYDTVAKCYVNLDEISKAIRQGEDVQVVDAQTGDDLTRAVMTQIIMEDARADEHALPIDVLRELILVSDKAKNELLSWSFRAALDVYQKAQRAPIELVRKLFAPAAAGESELEQLRRRVSELEDQMRRPEEPAPPAR